MRDYLAVPPFWLEFPAAIEARFIVRGRPGRLKRFLLSLRAVLGVLLVLILGEVWLLGEGWEVVLGLRLFAVCFCVVGLLFLPLERFAAERERFMVWLCVVLSSSQVLTVHAGGGMAATLYEGALVLLLLLCNQVARVRYRQALPFTVLWWVLFVFQEVLHRENSWLGELSASAFAALIALMSLTAKRAMELDNRATFALKMLNAISADKLAQANAELQVQAHYDPLTQLANRRHFSEYYERMMRNAIREREWLAVLFIDVDFFKRFNDCYGHHAGDDCLSFVASVVRYAARRPLDMAARMGGEEFVVILPGAELQDALRAAEDLRNEIFKACFLHETHPLGRVTVSIGVCAGQPDECVALPSILDTADRALYQAKQAGRNRVFGLLL